MNMEELANGAKSALLNRGYDGYTKYISEQLKSTDQLSDAEKAKNFQMFADGLVKFAEQDGIREFILKYLPDEEIEDGAHGIVNFLMKNTSTVNGTPEFTEKLNGLMRKAIAEAQAHNAPNN